MGKGTWRPYICEVWKYFRQHIGTYHLWWSILVAVCPMIGNLMYVQKYSSIKSEVLFSWHTFEYGIYYLLGGIALVGLFHLFIITPKRLWEEKSLEIEELIQAHGQSDKLSEAEREILLAALPHGAINILTAGNSMYPFVKAGERWFGSEREPQLLAKYWEAIQLLQSLDLIEQNSATSYRVTAKGFSTGKRLAGNEILE
jgi:hypothetical protein